MHESIWKAYAKTLLEVFGRAFSLLEVFGQALSLLEGLGWSCCETHCKSNIA